MLYQKGIIHDYEKADETIFLKKKDTLELDFLCAMTIIM
jgi:hypothetical protein